MKKIYIVFTLILFCFTNFNKVEAQMSLISDAKSAILIEASTGTVLFEKNADEKRAPASMTKIMTMHLILQARDKGVINFNDIHTVSKNAASMGGSQIFLQEGEKMKIDDLFKSIAVASANDSAVALSERVGGTEANFVSMMNQEARRLGMKNTSFKNPTGLTDSGHISSARDMSILARELINTQKENILKYTSIYEDYIRDGSFWLVNTNKLVKHVDGVDGLKTGWTEDAGYCLTATMNLNGMRVIAVLMGSSSSEKRNQEITQLMQYGISNFETKVVLEKGKVFNKFSNLKLKGKEYVISNNEEVKVVIKKGEQVKNIDLIPTFTNINDNLTAGTLVVKYGGNKVAEIPIYINQKVEKKPFIKLLKDVLFKIVG